MSSDKVHLFGYGIYNESCNPDIVTTRSLDSELIQSVLHTNLCLLCFKQIESNDKIFLSQCFHSFHKSCMEKWRKEHQKYSSEEQKCPQCGKEILPPFTVV